LKITDPFKFCGVKESTAKKENRLCSKNTTYASKIDRKTPMQIQ